MLKSCDEVRTCLISGAQQGHQMCWRTLKKGIFLKREFRKQFSFEKHVAIDVTFQRFDSEWEEYVDLDDDETVSNKEKLKVVVTSKLETPATTDDMVFTEQPAKKCPLFISIE